MRLILLLLLLFQTFLAFGKNLKVVIHSAEDEKDVLLYRNDTLYAIVDNTDTTFIAEDEELQHYQSLLRNQNQFLAEEGLYFQYPEIIAIAMERMADLLENKSEFNYKQKVRNDKKIITFYGPICLMLRRSYQVAIKKCVFIIENGKLIKEACSYYKHKDLCFPAPNTECEFVYDEDGRIVKIFNKGKMMQMISYIEE